jgi:hypothetical protein
VKLISDVDADDEMNDSGSVVPVGSALACELGGLMVGNLKSTWDMLEKRSRDWLNNRRDDNSCSL